MRIDEIHVDGFGLIHARSLEPAPGLTVIRGQNEAGKSTLLAFVRAMLFGFETRRYKAMAGGRRGGWLNVSTRDGNQYRIERYGETGGQGRLRVLDAAGADLGAGTLPILLQGVEQQLFRNVFAFGLDELAQFDRLTEGEVAARIYGAGLGLGAISALEVEAALQGEREALFKPGGHNPAVNALLRELEEIDARLRGIDLPGSYAKAVTDLTELDRELSDAGSRLVSLRATFRRTERVRDAWEPWLDLRKAQEARGDMGEVQVLPSDLPERLAGMEARAQDADEKVADLELRRQNHEVRLAQIVVDDLLLEQRDGIEELTRLAERDRARDDERRGVEDAIRLAERERDEALQRLGPTWTVERVAAFDDSVSVQSEISGRFRTNLETAATRVALAKANKDKVARDLDSAQTELEIINTKIAEIEQLSTGAPDVADLERRFVAVERASADAEAARQRADLAAAEEIRARDALERAPDEVARIAQAARAARDALTEANQAGSLLAGLPPESTPPTLGPQYLVPIVVGGIGIMAGLLIAVVGGPAVVGVAIGAAGVVAGFALWRFMPAPAQPGGPSVRATLEGQVKTARDRAGVALDELGLDHATPPADLDTLLARCAEDERLLAGAAARTEDAERARREVEQAHERLAVASSAAGVSAAPAAEELADLRAALNQARDQRARRLGLDEQAGTLQQRIERLEHDAQEANDARARAEGRQADALAEWAEWLRGHDLEPTFDRETAKTVIDAVAAAKRPLRLLAGHQERRDALAQEHEAFVDTLMAVVAALGWERERPGDRSSIDRIVLELERGLREASEAERSRRATAEQLEALGREEAEARDAAAAASEALEAVLAEHGHTDLNGLRSAIACSDAARGLDEAISKGRHALTALSGPGAALDNLLGELAGIRDIAEITAALDAMEVDVREAESEQGQQREAAGALRESIAQMERDVAATEDRQRREDLLARLQAEAEAWSVRAVARHLLRQSREAYEAAHRPAVIEAAERYFTQWTSGRYRQILAPLGKQVEEVEHQDGTRVALANLSTGTAQQLYLAIRFGLVEHFAANAEPLPIVMDDILVNFDDERAALAAKSIEALAEQHQVIYFTCHPETPLSSGTQLHLERLENVAQALAAQP